MALNNHQKQAGQKPLALEQSYPTPDWEALELEGGALRTDISSQSGGNLNVDIAEQSLSELNVHVTNAAGDPASVNVENAIEIDDSTPVDVNVVSSALPTGAATAANQQTDALTDAELRASAVSTKEIRSGTAATTTPSVGTTTTTVLAANANRLGAIISNPTGGTTVYINFGAAATVSHHELNAKDKLAIGQFTGEITGIVSSGSQTLTVTEFTS